LLGAGLPVNRPLLYAAPLDIEASIGADIRGTLTRWLNIELLAAHLAQDSKVYFHYLEKFSGGRFEILPTQVAFYRLQGAIAHFISNENAGRTARGFPPWDNAGFDVEAINAEGDDEAYWSDSFARTLDRTALVLDATGNIWAPRAFWKARLPLRNGRSAARVSPICGPMQRTSPIRSSQYTSIALRAASTPFPRTI